MDLTYCWAGLHLTSIQSDYHTTCIFKRNIYSRIEKQTSNGLLNENEQMWCLEQMWYYHNFIIIQVLSALAFQNATHNIFSFIILINMSISNNNNKSLDKCML